MNVLKLLKESESQAVHKPLLCLMNYTINNFFASSRLECIFRLSEFFEMKKNISPFLLEKEMFSRHRNN